MVKKQKRTIKDFFSPKTLKTLRKNDDQKRKSTADSQLEPEDAGKALNFKSVKVAVKAIDSEDAKLKSSKKQIRFADGVSNYNERKTEDEGPLRIEPGKSYGVSKDADTVQPVANVSLLFEQISQICGETSELKEFRKFSLSMNRGRIQRFNEWNAERKRVKRTASNVESAKPQDLKRKKLSSESKTANKKQSTQSRNRKGRKSRIWAFDNQSKGMPSTFKARDSKDSRFSATDLRLNDIGSGGGDFVKQDHKRTLFEDWDHCYKLQKSTWQHRIWIDPSGPAIMLHPFTAFQEKDGVKVIRGKCPTEINLAQEFGTHVEFIYMTPPWNNPNMGNGRRGYFTIDHLKKLCLTEVQKRGFVFMWIPFEWFSKIKNTMKAKGYQFVDSCGTMRCNFAGEFSMKPRNPHAKKDSKEASDLAGRMSGMSLKGTLWKKAVYKGKKITQRHRIGNQIMYDCFQWRTKTNPYTGQLEVDDGYSYQMYQYLVIERPKKEEELLHHALHLWCRPRLTVSNFGGVSYYPDYDFERKMLSSPGEAI